MQNSAAKIIKLGATDSTIPFYLEDVKDAFDRKSVDQATYASIEYDCAVGEAGLNPASG